MRDLQAHVDKLTEILEDARPCNHNCDLAAIQAWVNPADQQRVAELRDKRTQAVRDFLAAWDKRQVWALSGHVRRMREIFT